MCQVGRYTRYYLPTTYRVTRKTLQTQLTVVTYAICTVVIHVLEAVVTRTRITPFSVGTVVWTSTVLSSTLVHVYNKHT